MIFGAKELGGYPVYIDIDIRHAVRPIIAYTVKAQIL
jgi:hypothetical protein